jgi:putative membrane protein
MSEDTIADRRVHPGTIAIKFLKDAPRTVIGIPAVLALTSEIGWPSLILLALAAVVIIAVFEWLGWRSFRYGIGARELVIESGILSRNRRAIPFERVQDVDIERGPLQRLVGLAKVKIETGGSASDEGLLDSITLAEADAIRAAIRAGRAHAAAATDAEVPATPPSRLLYALSPRRLVLLGLFNFSMLYLAVLFGILNTVEPWIPFDIYDPGRWLGLVGEERVQQLTAGGAAAILLLALLLGVITGLVTTTLREFGFRLLDEGRRFRRERGLTTRSEIVLPKSRIQLALIRTGPIRRALGFADLQFQTLAGSGGGSGGQQSVAPLARSGEIATLIDHAGNLRLPGPGRLRQVARGHVTRSVLRGVGLPLAVIVIASWWEPLVLLGLFALPLLGIGAVIDRRFSGYALDDDLLFVRGGLWRQRLWIVPAGNFQALSVTRSPLQRLLGLATLVVDTAGAPVLGGPRLVDVRLETARDLADRIAGRLRGDQAAAAETAAASLAPAASS